MGRTIGDFVVTVLGIAIGVGVGLLLGAWLIQQVYGVLL
jgi:hypothetical protein